MADTHHAPTGIQAEEPVLRDITPTVGLLPIMIEMVRGSLHDQKYRIAEDHL